jgi:hypothetical protein
MQIVFGSWLMPKGRGPQMARLTIRKGGDVILRTHHNSMEHLRRIANEWYAGRSILKAGRGHRARKPMTVVSLNKAVDPEGLLKCYTTPLWSNPDGKKALVERICTDDPCGGRLIEFVISDA